MATSTRSSRVSTRSSRRFGGLLMASPSGPVCPPGAARTCDVAHRSPARVVDVTRGGARWRAGPSGVGRLRYDGNRRGAVAHEVARDTAEGDTAQLAGTTATDDDDRCIHVARSGDEGGACLVLHLDRANVVVLRDPALDRRLRSRL